MSFAAIGAVLIALRSAGAEIGWGFQLQSPLFVAAMIYVLFAVGLNLSGVFTIGERMGGLGLGLAARESYAGSFWTGALATLVGHPVYGAIHGGSDRLRDHSALVQDRSRSSKPLDWDWHFPTWRLRLPRGCAAFCRSPACGCCGSKQILAFPVYGTAVWLAYVLSLEAGAEAATAALAASS